MAFSVTSVINRAQVRYRDLTRAQALYYIQMVHDEIIALCRMTDSTFDVPIVASQSVYTLDPSILRVWKGQLVTDDVSEPWLLDHISQRWIDFRSDMQPGQPRRIFRSADPTGSRYVALSPPPYTSSLVVSSATATTPIVIGFTQPHGLVTGAAVYLTGLQGIAGANGDWPTVTVLDTTHISLDNSVGTGAYTSGGIGATPFLPFLRLYVSVTQVLLDDNGTTLLPTSVRNDQAYVSGIWKFHATSRHTEDLAEHSTTYAAEQAMLVNTISKTMSDVVPKASPNLRRIGGRGRRYPGPGRVW